MCLRRAQGFPTRKCLFSKDVKCSPFGLKRSWARGHTIIRWANAASRGGDGRRGIFRSVRFSTDVLAQGQGFPAFKRRSSKDVTCTTFGLKTSWARGHTHLIGQIAALRGRSGQGRPRHSLWFRRQIGARASLVNMEQTPFLAAKMAV